MHPWNLNEDEAKMLQESLAADCVLEGEPNIDTVAGLDISVYPDSRIAIASSALYSIADDEIVDEVVLIGDLTFPYIPGLLAFREAPLMIKTVMKLNQEPDCLLVDGHGYAHPRRFGLASHLGLLLDIPAVGCAKTILVGEYDEPAEEKGDYTDIWDGEPIGYAYRSLKRANPIFLSPGHMIRLQYLPELIERTLDGRTKLPVPLHHTHNLATGERKRLEQIIGAFGEEKPVFLVGGCLRDLLMGRVPRDYDILVTDLTSEAKEKLKKTFSGHFFPLDKERDIFRLTGDDIQIDVTDVDEQEIVDDLKGRDFTINSIALDLTQESWIDPTRGREDAEDEILRPSSGESIRSDPLRVLRAYRLAQHHNLVFHEELDAQIDENAGRLTEVSKERIVEELLRIVTGPDPAEWYRRMHNDSLLSKVPFFRVEGGEDLEFLTEWEPVLESLGEPFARAVHGSFRVLDGLKAGRVIAQRELSDWPFHRCIKTMVRASYEGLDVNPTFDVLNESHVKIYGRIIGRGIWEKWNVEKFQGVIETAHNFLTRREALEKEIVEAVKGNGNIGEEKKIRLQNKLPELWSDTVRV